MYLFQGGPLVIGLQPLMCPSLLRLNQPFCLTEAGVVAGAAARQTEKRKHTCNDPICSQLGWRHLVHGEEQQVINLHN